MPALLLGVALICAGCTEQLLTTAEVAEWKSSHGLSAVRSVGPVEITAAIVLPGECTAPPRYTETSANTYVLLTYAPSDRSSSVDVVFHHLDSFEDYVRRLHSLSLGNGSTITMVVDTARVTAIGAEMMYDVGLSPYKRVIVALPISLAKLSSSVSTTLIIRDDAFTKSIIAFPIDGSSLQDLPEIRL